MTKNLEDLIYSFKSLVDCCPSVTDPSVVPIPFSSESFEEARLSSRITVGYYVHDGFFRATPPAARAVTSTVDKLKQAGHECIGIKVAFSNFRCARAIAQFHPSNVDSLSTRQNKPIGPLLLCIVSRLSV